MRTRQESFQLLVENFALPIYASPKFHPAARIQYLDPEAIWRRFPAGGWGDIPESHTSGAEAQLILQHLRHD